MNREFQLQDRVYSVIDNVADKKNQGMFISYVDGEYGEMAMVKWDNEDEEVETELCEIRKFDPNLEIEFDLMKGKLSKAAVLLNECNNTANKYGISLYELMTENSVGDDFITQVDMAGWSSSSIGC